ncbi:ArnT family glycosyltransferase [Moheibacter sediminis]|uniref:Dolichyl-phosphate-mannose-protein mannosyltransferase n=1 Tax=Moheibacter sediminis TaxID=1434700 RepID=A0A1W2C0X2_9FLAO|nr:glycosyltransferase family 39 protein [Moheibacter sediminis]SMC78378.1 Dolichyl-phosphate-mannose-protein mannosyltransferase [Moheibacter sediminis]
MPDKRLIIGILIMLTVNILQAFFTPISEDEAYYWLWSQNLDWGYFDHPPMVAWWISLGYSIFQNELGVRLVTVLLNSFSYFFLWEILKPKTRNQVKLFWTSVLSVLIIHFFSFITTPDAPLLFFTLLYLYVLQKFISNQNLTNTLLLGFSMAGLVYSKYHGILVIIFTLIPLIKDFYQNKKLYGAILFGIVLYLPHTIWIITHDFSPLRYHFMERSADDSFQWQRVLNYFGMYFMGAAPMLSYFIFNSIFRFKSKDLFRKSILSLAVIPGIFFLFSLLKDNVQPQWLLISFIAMILLMYWNYSETQDTSIEYQDVEFLNQNARGKRQNNLLIGLGIAGIALVLALRILIAVPSISPFTKNEIFAENAGKLNPVNPVFEKYQEASVYNFFHPDQRAVVHRTLGNRKSQFDLWNWEEEMNGKTITFISPWTQSENSFKGFKNRDYFLKVIPEYETYHLVEVKTLTNLETAAGEKINLGLKITNYHSREIEIGGNSNLQFTVNYYQDFQYNILYSPLVEMGKIILAPGEELDIQISFLNISKPGDYKACVGINNSQIGTTYVSNVVNLNVK